ncbi:MAG: 4-vinyl reductase [Candidatus Aenigmatarchaeota archaeon]
MLKTGQIKIEKNGRILSEGVQMILFPAITLAKLYKDVDPKILYKIGLYQAEKAIKLHSRYFGLVPIRAAMKFYKGILDNVVDFMIKSWSVDGWGKIIIEKFDKKKREMILTNYVNPVANCYIKEFGKAKKPIDHYFVGLFEGVIRYVLRSAVCKEIKCIACGDPACVFVIKW